MEEITQECFTQYTITHTLKHNKDAIIHKNRAQNIRLENNFHENNIVLIYSKVA